jgi:DNA-binding transcriptional regulator YiaG
LLLSDFKALLKSVNLNKREFAELVKMSYGTVNSWGVEGRAEVPDWVEPFIANYIKAQKLDMIEKIIQDKEV